MNIRYFTYLVVALVAGFVVVATQSFDASTAAWIAFGGGGLFALLGAGLAIRPGLAHRLVHAAIAGLGILIVIESLLASGALVLNLSLAGALGVLALAVAGLTLHELSAERVVHSLAVAPTPSDVNEPIAA